MTNEGEFKKRFEKALDGFIDRDDGDFWKVQSNLNDILFEAKNEYPSCSMCKYDWFKKWFGAKP